jgi:hypothetical protein
MAKVEPHAAFSVLAAAAEVAGNVATGGVLADIDEGLKVFQALEPPVQHALAALFHKLHSRGPKPTSPQPVASGTIPDPPRGNMTGMELPKTGIPDVTSTSLDPDNPYASEM